MSGSSTGVGIKDTAINVARAGMKETVRARESEKEKRERERDGMIFIIS